MEVIAGKAGASICTGADFAVDFDSAGSTVAGGGITVCGTRAPAAAAAGETDQDDGAGARRSSAVTQGAVTLSTAPAAKKQVSQLGPI